MVLQQFHHFLEREHRDQPPVGVDHAQVVDASRGARSGCGRGPPREILSNVVDEGRSSIGRDGAAEESVSV